MMRMCCGKVLNEVGTLMHTQQSELILVFYLNSIKKKAVRFSMDYPGAG